MRIERLLPRILLFVSPLLLWLAFRGLPAGSLGVWLSAVSRGNLVLLLLFEAGAFLVMGERWRYLLRESGFRVSLVQVTRSRLAGFAWSYLTPGPHVGGEPMQLLVLKRQGIPVGSSVSSLARDRLYELFGGLISAAWILALPGSGFRSLIGPAVAAIFLSFLVAGMRIPRFRKNVVRFVIPLAGRLPARRYRMYRFLFDVLSTDPDRPPWIRILLVTSVLWAPILHGMEMALFFSLSGQPLTPKSLMVLIAVSRIAHYVPVPGGIGVVEWGMMTTAAPLEVDMGTMAAYLIFIRLRDLIQVAAGILITLPLARGRRVA